MWLYGDLEKRPGVLGFVHSARKEPKGDRVRGILNWGPLAKEEAAQLVEKCRKLDLVDNVFKGGVHGAYVPVKAEVTPPPPPHRPEQHSGLMIILQPST